MWTTDQAKVVADVSPPAKNRSSRIFAWKSSFTLCLQKVCVYQICSSSPFKEA